MKLSIISSSSTSKKISRSMKVCRQSSKRPSPNLFLFLVLTKAIAENTLSTLAVATGAPSRAELQGGPPSARAGGGLAEGAALANSCRSQEGGGAVLGLGIGIGEGNWGEEIKGTNWIRRRRHRRRQQWGGAPE